MARADPHLGVPPHPLVHTTITRISTNTTEIWRLARPKPHLGVPPTPGSDPTL